VCARAPRTPTSWMPRANAVAIPMVGPSQDLCLVALRLLRNTIEIQNTLVQGYKDCLLWSDDWLAKPDIVAAVSEVQVRAWSHRTHTPPHPHPLCPPHHPPHHRPHHHPHIRQHLHRHLPHQSPEASRDHASTSNGVGTNCRSGTPTTSPSPVSCLVCLQERYLAQGAVAMLVSLIAATKDDGVVSEAFHACVAMLMGSDPEVRCCVHGCGYGRSKDRVNRDPESVCLT
jgi:hypothetical protein